MAEIEIKDQLVTLLKEIRAETAKIEAVSAALDRVAAKPVTTMPVTAKPVIAKPVATFDASSPTRTASMVSSMDIHDVVPPSSGHASVPIHTAELVPELPARCATSALVQDTCRIPGAAKPVTALDASSPTPTTDIPAVVPSSSGCSSVNIDITEWLVPELPARCSNPVLVHDICYIPGAATPLCTRGVSAPSRCAPPAPARRLTAALELDKGTPTRCLMLGLGAAAFSTGDDAFDEKTAGVVPVASKSALFAGLHMCIVPKVDASVHTMSSAECSNFNVNDTHGSKVSLLREDMFLGCSSPGKRQALRPIPWPSFACDIINFQPRSPWSLFKVTNGSNFPADAITKPFVWFYLFNQPPWPSPRICTIWWSCKGLYSQSELKPWPDERQHQCTEGDGPAPASSLFDALRDEWVLPSWDSGQQADVSYDQSSFANQYISCLPGYFLTGGQLQLSDACSAWQLFLCASSTRLLLARFLVQAMEPSGILRYVSQLAEAKLIGRFHKTGRWWNYMLHVCLSWRLEVWMGWETIVLACFENEQDNLHFLMLTLVLEPHEGFIVFTFSEVAIYLFGHECAVLDNCYSLPTAPELVH